MPYAPTVNDNSGQILAQGIDQGVNSLADSIQRSIAERKKKEEDRKAKEAVNAAGKGLFGEDFDVKDAKPEQYGQLINLAQQKRDEPMRQAEQRFKQAQIDNFALQAELQRSEERHRQMTYAQQATNQEAIQGAFNPTTPTAEAIQGGANFQNLPGPNAMDAESAMRYMAKNGADMATLRAYGQTAQDIAQAKKFGTPRDTAVSYLNPPPDAKVMVDANGNIHNLAPKADSKARREFTVGGRSMVQEAGHVFDAQTGDLVGPAKPLDPDTQTRMATRLSNAQAAAEIPKGYFESKDEYAKRVSLERMKANQAAQVLNYQLPYPDAMPAKAGRRAAVPANRVEPSSPAASRFQIVPEPTN
jgi:hypothetical protein